ncbi:MAG: tetratricopeptide repeat protein [bacterium]|nr:tetratricopeptide repeat protein [bacterium]
MIVQVLTVAGCSPERKALSEIKGSYEEGKYQDTILFCEHAIRKGVHTGRVYYYYGLALMESGRDFEAFRRFGEAKAADPEIAAEIAEHLYEKGRESVDAGRRRQALGRLKTASNMDSELDLGTLRYLVGDAYFEERDFERAVKFYVTAVYEYPDTSAAEGAFFNMAQCYIALGDSTSAIASLERQIENCPRAPLAGQARLKLVNMIYKGARGEFERGNYETVIEQITDLLERTRNVSRVQRARFLLGEAYERMEEYQQAYEQYKAVIREDRGASGRIVEKAREKINTLRDSGLL